MGAGTPERLEQLGFYSIEPVAWKSFLQFLDIYCLAEMFVKVEQTSSD